MAEEDLMLLVIKTDAKGAITETQILDDKFKNTIQSYDNLIQSGSRL